jgi:uncharacterized OB-fold protein
LDVLGAGRPRWYVRRVLADRTHPEATLDGGRCRECGLVTFPKHVACRACGHEMEAHVIAPVGSVEAWTTVRVATPGFKAPYALGYIRLDAGPRVLAGIAVDGPAIGRRVSVSVDGEAGLPVARALAR